MPFTNKRFIQSQRFEGAEDRLTAYVIMINWLLMTVFSRA